MNKVSVIIPVHNGERYLRECLDSVISQTHKDLEIIVVDDNSSDGSAKIIKGYKDKRIKSIELKKNMGAAVARNLGVEKATGRFICFIDADDYWALDKIQKQIKFITKNNYGFIYGGYAYDNKGRFKRVHVPTSIDYCGALKNTTIFTSTVMFDIKSISKEDIRMPNIKRGQDAVTWWNVLRKGEVAYAIDEVLAYYRVGNKGSLSHNKFRAVRRTWNIYKTQKLPLFKRLGCFVCYAFNATKRRL